MDINVINEKYGLVLEDLNFMLSFGVSERLLPYPKKEIEEALITQAKYQHEHKNRANVNVVVTCYMWLAFFIPYEKYNIVKKAYGVKGYTAIVEGGLDVEDAFIGIQNEITADMEKRAEVINKAVPNDAAGQILRQRKKIAI